MLKNKEVKCLLLGEIIILFIVCLIGYGFHSIIYNQYKLELIQNNSYIISAFIKNHPEYEEELVEAIMTNKGDTEVGLQILHKYGLDQVDTLDYLNDFEKLRSHLLLYGFIFVLVVFGLLSILYFYFVKRQYWKMNEIEEYMGQVLQGNYSMDIRDYEEGQVSCLKNEVYKLTIRLKEQSDQSLKDKQELEQILSDISHQLRTPLTSMYVINDLLEKEDIEKSMKKEILRKNRRQLERIEWLVTSLLKMSRLDNGSILFKLEKVPVRELVKNALEPLNIPMELKNINVEVECLPEIVVMVDVHWTIEALVNILKNAYEHTLDGGNIHIKVIDNPIYTDIQIMDTGTGISSQDLPHIFERFYTGSVGKESIGIGLNMAKKIIDKELGDISVTSLEGVGTTFSIKFYKNVSE